jgi:predicted CopG family antitoxin
MAARRSEMADESIGLLDEVKVVRVKDEKDEFSDACKALVKAERKFNRLDLVIRLDSSADVCKWFDLLEERFKAEKRVWELFTGGVRNHQMGLLYLKFRDSLFSGLPLREDA